MNANLIGKHAKIHLIGIGGVSMSGIAELFIRDGYTITGSDWNASDLTDRLVKDGAKIFIGPQRAENITNQDLVVYTAAVHEDNPERVRAKELGIPQVERAVILGWIMKDYEIPICISGTHGKTTTTGMVTQILMDCGCDPTVSIGGTLDTIGGNIRIGGKKYFVAEACEYHSSFLSFFPKISVILNVEEDHLDYFRDLDHIIETFHGLAELTADSGVVLFNCDDPNVLKAMKGCTKQNIAFGITDQRNYDFNPIDISHDEKDCYSYTLMVWGEKSVRVKLSVPGKYNVYNSLAAMGVAHSLGLDLDQAAEALSHYTGTHRRFEKKGELSGAVIVDDYAHHPTEIHATLTAALEMDYKNIYVVFQPHTFSRTYTLYKDFVQVFSDRGIKLILADIYAARETDTGLVSSKQLAADIPGALHLSSFGEIEEYLAKTVGSGDLVITMGAGDVYKIGENLLKKYSCK